MTTRMWTRKQTQDTVKALRTAGYPIKNLDGGVYKTTDKDDQGNPFFWAMQKNSGGGFIVRYHPDLFGE